ncbi:MAG: hypothetical protein AAFY22_00135 [Pseudomonadota bacterium]
MEKSQNDHYEQNFGLSRTNKLTLFLAGASLVLASCSSGGLAPRDAPFTSTTTAPDFDGVLLAVSDADMKAEGYVTGKVGRPIGQRDALTVFPFSGEDRTASGKIFASNSVMGWPQIVEPSPDGRYVYVVEVREEFPADVTSYEDLYYDSPAGSRLAVFDIADPLNPELVIELEAGVNPLSVSVTPDGRYLLTSSQVENEEIVVFRLEDGIPVERFTFPYTIPLPDVGAKADGIRAMVFHPSGNYIAAAISDHQVAFLKIEYDEAGTPVSVTQHGDTIDDFLNDTGTAIASGEFSENGRYYLVPDIGWGHQTAQHFLFSKRGRLISIAFDEGANGAHEVVDVEAVGWSPEGMSLSHDNKMVATVNMERTSVAGTFPAGTLARRTTFSTISLMTFDDQTGQLEKTDEQRFRGILPEDLVFDSDDDTLAVTIYQLMEFEPDSGFVEFWKVDRSGDAPKLVRTGNALPVTRGVHDLAIIPR